jgi:hypothetical protein
MSQPHPAMMIRLVINGVSPSQRSILALNLLICIGMQYIFFPRLIIVKNRYVFT